MENKGGSNSALFLRKSKPANKATSNSARGAQEPQGLPPRAGLGAACTRNPRLLSLTEFNAGHKMAELCAERQQNYKNILKSATSTFLTWFTGNTANKEQEISRNCFGATASASLVLFMEQASISLCLLCWVTMWGLKNMARSETSYRQNVHFLSSPSLRTCKDSSALQGFLSLLLSC